MQRDRAYRVVLRGQIPNDLRERLAVIHAKTILASKRNDPTSKSPVVAVNAATNPITDDFSPEPSGKVLGCVRTEA